LDNFETTLWKHCFSQIEELTFEPFLDNFQNLRAGWLEEGDINLTVTTKRNFFGPKGGKFRSSVFFRESTPYGHILNFVQIQFQIDRNIQKRTPVKL
jgi:hypothetical protein